MFLRVIGLQFFILAMSLPGDGIRMLLTSQNELGSVLFTIVELALFLQNSSYFFLKCFVGLTGEAIWPWSFLYGKVCNYIFSLLKRYRDIQVIQTFLSELWQFESRNLTISSKLPNIIILLLIFPYYPFNICRVCGSLTSLIIDIRNFSFLSFFKLITLATYFSCY